MARHFLTSGHLLALAAMLVVGACASTGPAPVEDLSHAGAAPGATSAPIAAPGGAHRVERGDTLYSIAFRNGLDYRDLARWNGIGAPYTIYVGQEIRLGPDARERKDVASAHAVAPPPASPASPASGAATQAVAATPAPPPFENVEPGSATASKPLTPAPPSTVPAATAAATLEAAAPAPAASAQAAAPAPPPPAAAPAPPPPAAPPVAESQVVGDIGWRWPVDGRVMGAYVAGDRTRQGIDIAGRAGDPVRAAANGSVVYSGNGLIGYGELIIIKHSPSFLSAYGHNRKRLVKEGDRVTAGQVIAEMGTGNGGRDALHFEIRRNGKPENPLVFLPRR